MVSSCLWTHWRPKPKEQDLRKKQDLEGMNCSHAYWCHPFNISFTKRIWRNKYYYSVRIAHPVNFPWQASGRDHTWKKPLGHWCLLMPKISLLTFTKGFIHQRPICAKIKQSLWILVPKRGGSTSALHAFVTAPLIWNIFSLFPLFLFFCSFVLSFCCSAYFVADNVIKNKGIACLLSSASPQAYIRRAFMRPTKYW